MDYLHHLLGSLPPWAYVAIIGGGVAAAFILPKFLGGQNSNASPTSASGNVTDAIDPNTGLPYPLSGYPGGALAGNNGQTTGSSADTAALLAELQVIADRLNGGTTLPTFPTIGGPKLPSNRIPVPTPPPASLPIPTPIKTPITAPATVATVATVATPTTSPTTSPSTAARMPAVPDYVPPNPATPVLGAVTGANTVLHITAQPSRASVAGGNSVPTTTGASLAARQRAATVAARLTRAGV